MKKIAQHIPMEIVKMAFQSPYSAMHRTLKIQTISKNWNRVTFVSEREEKNDIQQIKIWAHREQ